MLKYVIFEKMHSAGEEADTVYVTEVDGEKDEQQEAYPAWANLYDITDGAEEYDTEIGNKYTYGGCRWISDMEYNTLKEFVRTI